MQISRFVAFLSIGASVAMPGVALAQSGPPAQPGASAKVAGLEDIVVTAQRREERLQDVPVAVTAFGARELERRQILDVQALTANTPALTFTSTFYGNNDLILAIRGVAPGGVLPNVDQAVGTYVDGIYYARPEGSNFALVDISTAEVLRGPQGTLFGRNTIAGALNITTNRPTYLFGGSAKLAYGNYDARTATGVLNAPIIPDKLAARLVYGHVQHDGYGYNPTAGKDVADQNDDFVRASVRIDPWENVRIDTSFDYLDSKNHQPLWVLEYYQAGVSPANLAPYVAAPRSRISQAGFNPLNHSRIYDVTNGVTLNLGFATLKSIFGYRDIDFEGAADLDGTPLPNADVRNFDLVGHQYSEELQLGGKGFGDRLTWLAGAYYFHEKFRNSPISRTPTAINDNTINPDNKSMSVFAQVGFEIAPRLRLTAGARYVHDDRGMVYTPARYAVAASQAALAEPAAGTVTPAACPFTAIGLNQSATGCLYRPDNIKFNYVPFTFGLDYKLPGDGLAYAKVSKGFRSGGFQQASGTTRAFYTPFGAENVLSFEAGLKLGLIDNHLRVGLAAYHSAYKNVQQNAVLSATPVIIAVLNAGQEKIYGGELEATALIGALRLNGSLGLIHPEFTKGPYVGSEIPTVAKHTYAISADYPLGLGGAGKLNLHLDYNYRSKVFFLNTVAVTAAGSVPYSAFQIASVTQAGYGLLNGQVSYDIPGRPLTLSVYGKNLANRYYAGRAGSFYGANYNSIVVGEPRTYGVSASYRF